MVKQLRFRSVGFIIVCCLMVTGGALSCFRFPAVQAQGKSLRIKQRTPVVNEENRITLQAVNAEGQPLSNVRWSSGSPDIAAVDAQTGEVQGVRQGFATVTAFDGATSDSVFVVVARVRKGNGNAIPGDTKLNQSGQVFISNPVQNVILQASQALTSATQVFAGQNGMRGLRNGLPTQSLFAGPTALTVDESVTGGIYVADTLNHSLRKISYRNQVETVLGTGTPGISPFDGQGKVPFELVQFNGVRGVANTAAGNLLVADTDNHAIYSIDNARGVMWLLAGKPGQTGSTDGTGREARFSRPAGLALSRDGKILAVADQDNRRVRFLELGATSTGEPTCQVSTAGTASQTATFEFDHPTSVSFDPVGNLVVVDASGVYVITRSPGRASEVIPLAQPGVSFGQAASVTVRGTTAYVLDAEATSPETALNAVTVGAPEITELSQEIVRAEGGESVVLTGKNFAPESLVFLGDSQVKELTVDSATQISFVVPKQLFHGERVLTVQTRGGIAQTKLSVRPKPFAELADGEITTVVGGFPFRGEGGKATDAALASVSGVTIDASGNLMITSPAAQQIHRVDAASGLLNTIVGSGSSGSTGDGEPALSTRLDSPTNLVFDRAGNMLIADFNRVRKVDAVTGLVSTVAGGGTSTQDGIPATQAQLEVKRILLDQFDNLYISGYYSGYVKRVDAQTGLITTVAGNGKFRFSGDGVPATQTGMGVDGMAFDQAGNLFLADWANHRIRRVDAQTQIITTVAGTGIGDFSGDGGPARQAPLRRPTDIAFDASGNLLIVDSGNARIRRVNTQSGTITTIAGTDGFGDESGDGGPARNATLRTPSGIAVDGQGNIFIATYFGSRVRRVDAQTGIITTVAGGGVINPAPIATSSNFHLALIAENRSGNLLISNGAQVVNLDLNNGSFQTIAGTGVFATSGDGGSALFASFIVEAMYLNPRGDLILANGGSTIRIIDADTGIVDRLAGKGKPGFSGDGGPALQAKIRPGSITTDKAGNIYFSEFNRIRRIDVQTNIITTIAGTGKSEYSGDGGPALKAGLAGVFQLAFDSADNLYLADAYARRIRRIDARTGIITTVAGTGNQVGQFSGDGGPALQANLFSPTSLAIDRKGNIFIGDYTRIHRVDAQNGVLTTIAGGGETYGTGDGGPASDANLVAVQNLFLDQDGNLFFTSFGQFPSARVIKGVGK